MKLLRQSLHSPCSSSLINPYNWLTVLKLRRNLLSGTPKLLRIQHLSTLEIDPTLSCSSLSYSGLRSLGVEPFERYACPPLKCIFFSKSLLFLCSEDVFEWGLTSCLSFFTEKTPRRFLSFLYFNDKRMPIVIRTKYLQRCNFFC